MPFKTAAEMFGDGGGFGPAVPYSTTNPPGTSAGNRGIQFGEQLTAAIANRTHYALALNDEDLNTRVVSFETTGLDAAYDRGTVGPAGGGRLVTKDQGAVETITTHSSVLGDGARDPSHFRANALGDTVASSVGFDFKARRVGANGQSGSDAPVGLLDRRVFAKPSGNTQMVAAQSATLNPGGTASTTVRVAAGRFHAGTITDLVRGYDLVEISGGTAADGLYVFSTPGGTDADAVLVNLDGSSPSFPASTACTVTLYRIRSGSFGAFTNRTQLHGVTMMGMSESDTVLDLVPGRNRTDTTDGGASHALRVIMKGIAGIPATRQSVDFMGRTTYVLNRNDILSEVDQNLKGGNYATYKDSTSSPGLGHLMVGNVLSQRFDFMSLAPIDLSAITPPVVTPGVTTMTFGTNSPTQGEVLFSAGPGAEFDHMVQGVAGMVEISGTPSSGASDGLYWIIQTIITGNKGFYLRKLDGNLPSHFPTSGTFLVGRIFSTSVLGRRVTFANSTPVESGDVVSPIAYNVLAGGGESGSASLVLFSANPPTGAEKQTFIRAFRASPATPEQYQESFKLEASGQMRTRGAVRVGTGAENIQGVVIDTTNVNAEFRYGTARTRRMVLSLGDGQVVDTVPEWHMGGSPLTSGGLYWASDADLGRMVFPLNSMLREGMTITDIQVLWDPGAARVNPLAMQLALAYVDPNFGTPAAPAPVTVAFVEQSNSGAIETRSMATHGNLASPHTVVREGTGSRDYYLVAVAGTDGPHVEDRLYGIELVVTDPGPRNF